MVKYVISSNKTIRAAHGSEKVIIKKGWIFCFGATK